MAFDIHGDRDGPPVLYLHGVPSSRLEVHVFGLGEAAERAGVQLVAIDRAGIGGTDPRPGRTASDTAADVVTVADALGHPRFALLGYSAGTPFALATAAELSRRITMLGLVSGIAPGDQADLTVGQAEEVARMFRWARTSPRRLRAMLRFMKVSTRWPGLLVRAAIRGAPAADRAVLASPEAAEAFAAFLACAFEQGIDGVATDFRLAAAPWALSAADISVPVRLWHGDQDRNAPIAAARWLDRQLPRSILEVAIGDGHASTIDTRGQAILATLTGS